VPVGFDTNALTAAIRTAVAKATRLGYLRLNSVDSLSGQVYPTNIAHGSPVIRYEQGARENVDIRLLMKGGGCENVGRQYSLPDSDLDAGRDLKGVRRCILDAVWRAQGYGCAPGILGVCVGGDRSSGHEFAKEQFLRRLDDRSKVTTLARLEARIIKDVGEIGIGPMGLGGATTLLGVKVGSISRLPASYFVTVSFMCWAFRRRGVVLGPQGGVKRWLY
jgi:fumarate hydratase class I